MPSLLAWMREEPRPATALGDGELSSHVAWKPGEITFSRRALRWPCERTRPGDGHAESPRPYVRAALASTSSISMRSCRSADPAAPQRPSQVAGAARRPGRKAAGLQATAQPEAQGAEAPAGSRTQRRRLAAAPRRCAERRPAATPNVAPAAFDADVNLNIRETKLRG